MAERWTCYARPAATGRTCFHVNTKGIRGMGGALCCESCGCGRGASNGRLRSGDIDKQTPSRRQR